MRHLILILLLAFSPGLVQAQSTPLRLSLPDHPQMQQLVRFMLPRFTLKHRIRVEVVAADDSADLALVASADTDQQPYLEHNDGTNWALVTNTNSDEMDKLLDWLASDVGHNTMTSFQIDGIALFRPAEPKAVVKVAVLPEGDIDAGEVLALQHCGRCHVINEKNRFGGIGSTPSFGALRTLPGWLDRFEAFFTLNPHPSFTQVEGMTEPFSIERPSHIAPIHLTLDDVEAITAYAASIKPKDLGGAVESR